MKTMSVGELKPHFSAVLNDIKAGEEIIVSYGRKKEKVAVIIPYEKYKKQALKKQKEFVNNKKNLEFYTNSWVKDSEFDKVIKDFESIDMEKWQ